MRLIMISAGLMFFVLSVSGCETVKGFAKDMANTGNNIREISEGAPEFK